MVGVLTLISLFLLVGAATLAGILKIGRAAADDLQTLMAQKVLADQFRADVARARTAPDNVEDFRAGPSCLILQGPKDQSIVYHWEAGKLQRAERKAGKWFENRMAIGPHMQPQFDRSGPNQHVVVLRLRETRNGMVRDRLEIAAALGGDRQ
jgi:hypothetical protein